MLAMTSRQRVQMALRHLEPDRVPIDFGARHSIHMATHRALTKHLGFEGGDEIVRSYLNFSAEPDPRLLDFFEADVIQFQCKPGRGYVFQIDPETDSWSDEWGITCRRPPGGCYYDPYKYPLAAAESVADIERFRFPDPMDPHRMAGVIEALRAAHTANSKAILLNAPAMGIWMLGFYLRGLEQGLMDLATQPDLAEALAERITQWFVTFWETTLPSIGDYLDVVQMEGDLGSQEGPLFSPRLFRQIFKPRLRRIVDAIKQHTRAKVLLHACGSVYWAIPDLLEVGIDVLNPVQVNAAEMDTARLKREFGRDISFWGGGCDTILLQQGTPAQVKAEVKRRIADLGPGGGYVFGSIHNIAAGVPPENVVAMFRAAWSYGAYKGRA
jgi:uroporphyrinogen decarboxylase